MSDSKDVTPESVGFDILAPVFPTVSDDNLDQALIAVRAAVGNLDVGSEPARLAKSLAAAIRALTPTPALKSPAPIPAQETE